MNKKSYYQILNVNFDSTSLEIKRSYRKLANKYHPDKNNGNAHYSEMFKDINAAYKVLSAPSKRTEYDLSLIKNETFSENDVQSNREEYKTEESDLHEDKNLPLHITLNITPKETLEGTQKTIRVSLAILCPLCKGYGVKNRRVCSECLGTGQKIEKKVFNIDIKPLSFPGTALRLRNVGHESRFHASRGDIIVNIEWEKGQWYMIDNELHTYYQLSKKEYKKGSFVFTNYDNSKINVILPENIKEGQILRLKEKGWKYQYHLDLYIEIRFKKGNFLSKILGFSF